MNEQNEVGRLIKVELKVIHFGLNVVNSVGSLSSKHRHTHKVFQFPTKKTHNKILIIYISFNVRILQHIYIYILVQT